MNEPTNKTKRTFSGVVTSAKMPKTLVVKVSRVVTHPKYKKQYSRSKKFKVHYENGEFKTGDSVKFVECRPLSRDKRWRIIK
ncbi:MAG: 30S ribosomal protein S17 [Patescibacteria group bacterium]